jgi:hypothetical protein
MTAFSQPDQQDLPDGEIRQAGSIFTIPKMSVSTTPAGTEREAPAQPVV